MKVNRLEKGGALFLPVMNENILHLPHHLRDEASKLPEGQEYTILTLPPEGEGHNVGLLKVASICYKMGVEFEDTVAHLANIYSSDRPDHNTAPRRAALKIWGAKGEMQAGEGKEKLPDLSEEMLLRFRRMTQAEVIEKTPHKTNIKPTAILKNLFQADEIINIQHGKLEAGTLVHVRDLEKNFPADELATYKFLNPSIFKKVEGVLIPDGDGGEKLSTRCNANVKERPYMLLEIDSKDEALIERFTSFAMELAKFIPLKLVVDTGNKSQHFWFDARNAEPKEVSAIFALACQHGADKQMGVRSQIARMPNVSASDEGRAAQRVIYYDHSNTSYPNPQGQWDVVGFEKFINSAKQLDFYYFGERSKYYMQSNNATWISLNNSSLNRQLAKVGFRRTLLEGELLSPVDDIISSIETDKSIEAALQGASGRHAGFYMENGFSYLVLKSPTIIKPRKGQWDTIKDFLTHMFDHTPEQLAIFYAWCSSSAKDFRNGGKRRSLFSPAQFLNILGEPNSGKSLLLKYILPFLFGGRSADADDLFSEKSVSFNSDLFQCELLYLDDTDILLTDHKSRHKFGERIKSYTVGAGGNYHQKFGDKIPIAPWWRMVRMMNLEPATLDTLPQLDEGVADKLILLKARSMTGGLIDTTTAGWFNPVRDRITSELPAFLHFLLEEFFIDANIADPIKRFAVKSYHNPAIVDLLNADSPERFLLQKIDKEASHQMFTPCLFGEDDSLIPTPWEGTSSDLYTILIEVGSKNSQERFKRTCPSPRVLVNQLRQLAKEQPSRFNYSGDDHNDITPKKKNGIFYWRIAPFQLVEEKEEKEINDEDCI